MTTTQASKAHATRRKKVKKVVSSGIVAVSASFNNTIITVSDNNGDVIAWSSSGSKGFKGSRRSTPFAAQIAAEDVARRASEFGMKSCSVVVTGPGSGRDSAVRAIAAAGMKILAIEDRTPVPHNGCRPPKRRRC